MKKSALLAITGFALGLATGLLLSPDKGAKSRRKWRKKGKQYQKAFEEKLAEYKQRASGFKEPANTGGDSSS
jgi:gas vesicle protein